ncbi:hypothetical protein [Nocardioides sp. SYSU DS0663]|uniref:hypothetical protein n=1 Tax=Nocardioides sp. SYSU DS0663 TaxID=3416445 RepID=UPI003F4BE7B3
MPDHVEDLAVLREQSDVLLQQTAGAQQAVGPVEGADATGEVVVHLDADGRLRAVQVGFTWDRRLTGARLPGAVLEAFAGARTARLEAYAAAVAEAADGPAPRARPGRHGSLFVDAFRDRLAAAGETRARPARSWSRCSPTSGRASTRPTGSSTTTPRSGTRAGAVRGTPERPSARAASCSTSSSTSGGCPRPTPRTSVGRSPTRCSTRSGARVDWVPWGLGWAVDKFMALWDVAMEKMGQFWDKVGEFVSYIGAPWDLNAAADDWVGVGGPVAARATEADRSQSEVDYQWKGRAADRYAFALSAQQKALTAVQSKLTAPMGPALSSLATALYIFFGAVIAAIAILVVAIVTATGEAISILGLPAVPPTVLTGAAAAIAAISAAILNLRGAASSAQDVFSQVASETGDFGAQGWPAAVIG